MNRLRLLAATVALALIAGAPAAAIAAVPTDTSDFTFDSFDGLYELETDGAGRVTMHVTETLVAVFPDFDQNRGIIRSIPLKDGEVPLGLSVLSVKDENGASVPFERNDYDGFAEIALGTDDFVHGRTTYVIEYTMRDTVRHFEDSDGDEFYWDINGNGWAQTFGQVSAHVQFSPSLAAHLTGDASCYLGYYGDSGECGITRDGADFDATVGPVYAYNTLTLAIGLDGGTVQQPSLPKDSWIVQLAPKVLLGLAVLLLLISIVVKVAVWRDAPGRGTIIAQYEPPEHSNLMLDANIVGRSSAALPALLIDLAVRGIIKVVDLRTPESDIPDKRRYSVQLIRADGATADELKVLVTLFGVSLAGGKRVNPASLSAEIGAALYGLPASTAAKALSSGYRAQPVTRIPRVVTRIVWLAVLAFVPIGIWAVIFDVLDGNVIWPAIGTFVLAVAIPSVLIRPPLLTAKGADLRDHLRGIKQYLTVAEEERIRVLQSPEGAERVDVTDTGAMVKLNERLLGYAVLWGVEDRWLDTLRAQYPQGTPEWFDGASIDSSFLSTFSSSSMSSVRPIATSSSGGGSSWSSSGSSGSSSGSSGGGFSGGGGGGGGGGGR